LQDDDIAGLFLWIPSKWLRKEDEEKTSFITPSALFAILECLKVSAMLSQHSAE
jgi:hypothetical protein